MYTAVLGTSLCYLGNIVLGYGSGSLNVNVETTSTLMGVGSFQLFSGFLATGRFQERPLRNK